MPIPGYANRRLISFRRARMKQSGEHITGAHPYLATQQQDIISANNFVLDLENPQTKSKGHGSVAQDHAETQHLMARQKIAGTDGVVRCQTTIWHFSTGAPGIGTPKSLVPQNLKRVFLMFCLIPANGDASTAYFSFGAPLALTQSPGAFGGFELRYDPVPGEVTEYPTQVFNSTVIPIDEIFIAKGTTGVGFDVLVYEGTPLA